MKRNSQNIGFAALLGLLWGCDSADDSRETPGTTTDSGDLPVDSGSPENTDWEAFPIIIDGVDPQRLSEFAPFFDVVAFSSYFAPYDVEGRTVAEAGSLSFGYAATVEPVLQEAQRAGLQVLLPLPTAGSKAVREQPIPPEHLVGDGVVREEDGTRSLFDSSQQVRVPLEQGSAFVGSAYEDYWAARLHGYLTAAAESDDGQLIYGFGISTKTASLEQHAVRAIASQSLFAGLPMYRVPTGGAHETGVDKVATDGTRAGSDADSPPRLHTPQLSAATLEDEVVTSAEARRDFWEGMHRAEGVYLKRYRPDALRPSWQTAWTEFSTALALLKTDARRFFAFGDRFEVDVALVASPRTKSGASEAVESPSLPQASVHLLNQQGYLVVTYSGDEAVVYRVSLGSDVCDVELVQGQSDALEVDGDAVIDSMSGSDGRLYRIALLDDNGACPELTQLEPLPEASPDIDVQAVAADGPQPLSLDELDALDAYLNCVDSCQFTEFTSEIDACIRQSCTVSEGEPGGPIPSLTWDKNLDGIIDGDDLRLAWLEYSNIGRGPDEQLICYESGAVVPIEACGEAECIDTHTAAECVDHDGDGIVAWQEAAIGTSDSDPQTTCSDYWDCGGFNNACEWHAPINLEVCTPRDCDGTCTAFHLETVAVDNDELILNVVFDQAPAPVTVLDLHLEFDDNNLEFVDARPLQSLTQAHKDLQVQHIFGTSNRTLRVTALSSGNIQPITPGPVAELLFRRIGDGQATVGFSGNNSHQLQAIAPAPETGSWAELTNDARWGDDIVVPGVNPDDGRELILSYSFDNSQTPLDVNRALTGVELCDVDQPCRAAAQGTDDQTIAVYGRRLSHLGRLQRGLVQTSQAVDGFSANAAFLDGFTDHIEMPVTFSYSDALEDIQGLDHSFSISSWVYLEGDENAVDGAIELLFSHNDPVDQTTRFGLFFQALPGQAASDLYWFEGDLNDRDGQIDSAAEPGGGAFRLIKVANAISHLQWKHIGFAFDDSAKQVHVYIDGDQSEACIDGSQAAVCPTGRCCEDGTEPITTIQLAPTPGTSLSCPDISSAGVEISIPGSEVDLRAGTPPPTAIFFDQQENNLHGLERMDAFGLSRRTLIRTGDTATLDVDYSPTADRIVYISTETGSYEVWLADADGANPIQLTDGFGSLERGVFARRPQWSPKGDLIVFESNAFGSSDNPERLNQLYAIHYDPYRHEVTTETGPGNTPRPLLNYQALLADQDINDARLSDPATGRHHTDVQWIRSGSSEDEGQFVYRQSSANYRSSSPVLVTLRDDGPDPLPMQNVSPGDTPDRAEVLSVHVGTDTLNTEHTSYLIATHDESVVETQNYSITQQLTGEGNYRVTVTYTGADDIDETPFEIRDLLLEYDDEHLSPLDPTTETFLASVDPWFTTNDKDVRLADRCDEDSCSIEIKVYSPINREPIPSGTPIVDITFFPVDSDAIQPFRALSREVEESLFIRDQTSTNTTFTSLFPDLEEVFAADFSPDGSRLVLSGIRNARPIVVVTSEDGANDENIAERPMRVEQLDWETVEQAFPCNWVGAHRQAQHGEYRHGLRGGIDELKLHGYARSLESFQSEADRGRERLDHEAEEAEQGGPDADSNGGVPTPQQANCSSSLDCPTYQLCDPQTLECIVSACDDDSDCTEGRCALMPIPANSGYFDDDEATLRFVCSVECGTDSQCQQQECLNGICRFCDDTNSCIECSESTDPYTGLQYMAGCPDRNSFECYEGSCETECYAFENGQSEYLCNPGTEFCQEGRCQPMTWTWNDFAPGSLTGLGEMTFTGVASPRPTIAISQLVPVTFQAFGVADYLKPPQVIVEARSSRVFANEWFVLGKTRVYNTTQNDAAARPYTLLSPFPIEDLRFRLVLPPRNNFNEAATGYGDKTAPTPYDCLREEGDYCQHRPPGSRYTLGYRVGIPEFEARRACAAKHGSDSAAEECGYDPSYQQYLYGGQPGVVITDVTVGGNGILSTGSKSNFICSYEDGTDPRFSPSAFDTSGSPVGGLSQPPARIYYGDIQYEDSNLSVLAGETETSTTLIDVTTQPRGDGLGNDVALLNCNYNVETDVAGLTFTNIANIFPEPGSEPLVANGITETSNGCFVDTSSSPVPASCYEWDGDPTIDPFTVSETSFRTLDFDLFRGFGCELGSECFTSADEDL